MGMHACRAVPQACTATSISSCACMVLRHGTVTWCCCMVLLHARCAHQPAATALAVPTMRALNMVEHQNWQATKVARENPMSMRQAMNPAARKRRRGTVAAHVSGSR